ncbi:MAG: NUDIX hydrolase [Bacteroidetes bacterium]|nr:NUDIX hydrolase [Bacteroidota bacterium]
MLFPCFMSYKIPSITTDGIILKDKQILLIKRKNEPFKGKWALPGGFVEYGEKTEDAVIREVSEETGLKTKIRTLAGVYSDPNRDPRGHIITIIYVLDIVEGNVKAGDDASDVKFFDVHQLPALATDHNKIINDVIKRFEL